MEQRGEGKEEGGMIYFKGSLIQQRPGRSTAKEDRCTSGLDGSLSGTSSLRKLIRAWTVGLLDQNACENDGPVQLHAAAVWTGLKRK